MQANAVHAHAVIKVVPFLSHKHTRQTREHLSLSQASFYPLIPQINRLFSDPVSPRYLQRRSAGLLLWSKLGP